MTPIRLHQKRARKDLYLEKKLKLIADSEKSSKDNAKRT
jgi:hypothetical protein